MNKPIVTFLVLTFVLSVPFYVLILTSGKLAGGGGLYAAGIMWCPGISALLTCRLCGIRFGTLGWIWGGTRFQLGSYLIPFGYTFVAYVLIWTLGFGEFPSSDFVKSRADMMALPVSPWLATALFLLLNSTIGFVWSCASSIGEEIGWRGFLVPHLSRVFSFTATAFISGFIWALSHFPVLLFADYNSGTPAIYALTCFTVLLVSISFIYAWLRLRSGSLWTAVFLHASHNLFIQSIFTPLTAPNQWTPYAADEFGFMLPLVTLPVAFWFWRKRGVVPTK